VRDVRHLPAERLIQVLVDRRGRNPLFRAQDVADPHEVVVHHVRQVIGRVAVRLEQHQVLKLPVIDRDVAAQEVVHSGRAADGHLEPDHKLAARFGVQALALLRRQEAAATVVARIRIVIGALLFAKLGEPLFRAVAAVRLVVLDQPARPLPVQIKPLRLDVRPVIAADLRPFVPIDA
jgi:hypothetical protein